MFLSRSLCFVTSGLPVPLVPRPRRCSCSSESLHPRLAHRPEPGARPRWEQGPAAWSWWGVCLCWLGPRSRLGVLTASLYGVPSCPGFHLFFFLFNLVLVKLLAGAGLIESSCFCKTAAQPPGHCRSGLGWEVRPFGGKGGAGCSERQVTEGA